MDSDVLEFIRITIDDTDSSSYTFSDEFIESLYTENNENRNNTIAELFLLLAGIVLKGGVKSYTIGNESYSLYDANLQYLELSKIWASKSNNNNLGVLFQNDISKSTDDEAEQQSSFSNIMGGAYNAE